MIKMPRITVGKNTAAGALLGGSTGAFIGSQKDNSDRRAEDKAASKAQNENAARQNTNTTMTNYMQNPGDQFSLSNNPMEAMEQSTALSQVGALTGQNIGDVGRANMSYFNTLQDRRAGDDKVAQYMMDQRNRNKASVARSMAGRGVAGGVAASGMMEAGMAGDAAVAGQMQNRQDKLESEQRDYVKDMQRVKGEALAQGAQRGAAANMDTSSGQGIFGKIICTELHRQGILPDEVQEADKAYGIYMRENHPYIMLGYMILATPIVAKMRNSQEFTTKVASIAIPWAYHIAGKKNIKGWLVNTLGTPICAVVGFLNKDKMYVKAN